MSGVFTRDISRALRVSSILDSGVVGINCISYVRQSLSIKLFSRCARGDMLTIIDEHAIALWWQETVRLGPRDGRICGAAPFPLHLKHALTDIRVQALRAFTEPKTVLIK